MISVTTTASSAQFYDRNGVAATLRSQPVRQVVPTAAADDAPGRNQGDTVTLSAAGLARSQQDGAEAAATDAEQQGDTPESTRGDGAKASGSEPLTEEERQMVTELKQRDNEVRTHEMAHLATAGQYARGGPSYTYQQGPDGRRYAVGGEVPIDVGREKTPEETIQKMRTVRRAAMAPASPSPADRSIAATAAAQEAQAMREMQAAQAKEQGEQPGKAEEKFSGPTPPTEEDTTSVKTARRRTPLDILA